MVTMGGWVAKKGEEKTVWWWRVTRLLRGSPVQCMQMPDYNLYP